MMRKASVPNGFGGTHSRIHDATKPIPTKSGGEITTGSSWGSPGLFREQLESPWPAKCKGRLARTNKKTAKIKTENRKVKIQHKKYQTRKRPLRFGPTLRFRELLEQSGAPSGSTKLTPLRQSFNGKGRNQEEIRKHQKTKTENSKHVKHHYSLAGNGAQGRLFPKSLGPV